MPEGEEEKKGVTDYVVNAVVGINNNMMDSWDYTFQKLGVFENYSQKVNPDDFSAEDDLKTIEAAEKQMRLQPIPKNGFHTTTVDEICTANAVLRCPWGATFGQLMVIPVNRCSIGKTLGNVATIMDFAPLVNIPSFGMCFNILNPAVAVATAAATAAAGGKFTLVPMPCGATMAPTPWIPITKNVLGKIPILTKNSMSCCWGIGTIEIKHCGQGLAPNTYNGFMGPDWITTLQGNAQLVANVLGALGPLAGLGEKGIAAVANLAQKAAVASKIVKISQIGLKIGQVSSKLSKISKKVGKIGNIVAETGEAAANTVDAGIYLSQEKYGDAASSGADALIGAAGTLAGSGKMKGLNKSITKAASNYDVSAARKAVTKADLDIETGHANQKAAQMDIDAAEGKQKLAQKNLDAATNTQKNANTDLDNAKASQKSAQDILDNANKAKADADANFEKIGKSSADGSYDYESAKLAKTEEDMDVSIASADKNMADIDYANANKAKQDADVKVNNAKAEKEKVDQELAKAQKTKAKADAAIAKAEKRKAKAESRLRNAEKKADSNKDSSFIDEMWYRDYVLESGENAINDYNSDKKKAEEEAKKKKEDDFAKYTNYGNG